MNAAPAVMHFLFTLNDAYAPHLAATIVSLLESQAPARALHFHIISADFSAETKAKINSLKSLRPFETTYYDESDIGFALPDFPLRIPYITRETYYRCFAHAFVKGTDRIIHLDVDLLVLRDLSALWDLDLGGAMATGVRCPIMDGRHLTIAGFNTRKHLYALAGMNLFDLAAMRREGVTQKVFDICKDYGWFLRGQDQDILNLVFRDRMYELPPGYNFATSYLEDPRALRKCGKDPAYLESRRAPHVIHFSRAIKAWHSFGFNPYRKLYWKYLRKTPWKDKRPLPFPIKKYIVFKINSYKQGPLWRAWQAWKLSRFDAAHLEEIRTALRRNREKNYRGPKPGAKLLTHILPHHDIFCYLEKMLDCTLTCDPKEAEAALLWGGKYFPDRSKCLRTALAQDLPVILAEDGFIRSIDVPFLHDPGLSCTLDTHGIYYNADFDCAFDDLLNSPWTLSPEEKNEAVLCLQFMRDHGLSKYNAALPTSLSFNPDGKYKNVVLVVDQRKDDQSIGGAKADAGTFKRMLADAIRENPDGLILVKTHPDSNTGFFGGYYNRLNLKRANVRLLRGNINPVSLLKAVDAVYVVSSQMGLEALFCGKKVFCYGAPYYAGWGLTEDRGAKRKRARTRTIEEIFYASYIKFTRYFDPSQMKSCTLMDTMRYLDKRMKEMLA